MATTPKFIKAAFKDLRNTHGIIAKVYHGTAAQEKGMEDMDVRSRVYGDGFFIDFKNKTEAWGKTIVAALEKQYPEGDGYTVAWDGNPSHSIVISSVEEAVR